MMGVHRVHGDPDRHVRLVLRSLGWCAVRTRRAGGRSACALRRGVRHRGAERQLLPVAPRHDVRGVAGPVARGLSDVGEGGAGLTHARRLRSPEQWIERFTRCWHELGHRRGALLVQLHPAQDRDDARLDYFLGAVPPSMTVAVELRHPSWNDPQVYRLLERRNAAYVVMSGAGLPCVLKATAKLVYVRLHGPDPSTLYGGSYSAEDLRWWADRIVDWHRRWPRCAGVLQQ